MGEEQDIVATELAAEDWERVASFALWVHGERDPRAVQAGTLERLREAFPHKVSWFDFARQGASGIEFFSPVSTTMEPEVLATYYERFAQTDYTVWSFDVSTTAVYRDLDLVDVARRDTTPIYREWMEPMGVYFGCGATLAKNGVPYGSITLFREREAGDFTSHELRLLLEISRHVSVRLADLFPRGMDAGNARSGRVADLVAGRGVSPTEQHVLQLMLEGRTNAQIASDLFISESTVKKHVNALYKKLGVENRVQLAWLVSSGQA